MYSQNSFCTLLIFFLQCLSMLSAITEFFASVVKCIGDLKEENPSSSFINEWEDLFAQNVNLDMFHIWYILAGKIYHSTFLLQFVMRIFLYTKFAKNND